VKTDNTNALREKCKEGNRQGVLMFRGGVDIVVPPGEAKRDTFVAW
jgi:hypothetical protein